MPRSGDEPDLDFEPLEAEGTGPDREPEGSDLEELAARLESDPDECVRAFEGLEALDSPTRLAILDGLAELAGSPGVRSLLRLLQSSHDEQTVDLARSVLSASGEASGLALIPDSDCRAIIPVGDWDRPCLIESLVTAVDGEGRGTVGLSTTHAGRRTTALFLCDVTSGLLDAVGAEEDESPTAGSLLREASEGAGGEVVDDAPELAISLLAGGLRLSGQVPPAAVGTWLLRTVGQTFPAQPMSGPGPMAEGISGPSDPADLLRRSEEILDACPGWLDRSRLTEELAEEIALREGRTATDPSRDSGAYRFLFEHVLIHRLERYRGMLSWMARYYHHAGEPALALSAEILSAELADEQNAVPGHPFVQTLSSRSLDAAIKRSMERGGGEAARQALEGGRMDRSPFGSAGE